MRKLQKLAALGLAGSMALSLAACATSSAASAWRRQHPRFRRGYCREHCFRRRGRHPELGPVG